MWHVLQRKEASQINILHISGLSFPRGDWCFAT